MRVHELAKELNVSSKVLLSRLHDLGQEATSHMSKLDATAVELMREAFGLAPVEEDILLEETFEERHRREKPLRKADEEAEPPPKELSKPKSAVRSKEVIKLKDAAPEERAKSEPVSSEEPVKPAVAAAGDKAPQPKNDDKKDGPETTVSGKVVRVKGPVVVRDLADSLGLKPNQLVAELMRMNILASITQRVDVSVAKRVAEHHGFTLEHERRDHEHKQVQLRKQAIEKAPEQDQAEDLVPRPPVITFLGHVDHGKTSLLDKIRDTAVARGEHGGITQHIGAYTKEINGRSITFLDTPGHAAFTAMRARGANMTDIAVIVVAADDGIMPQTREAIQHAKAADVTIMVAANKVDLPSANPERVKQQLQAEGLSPEDWGGTTIVCPVSAVTGEGIDRLLEMILLQAEMLELKANPRRRATGYIIESRLEPGMGPTSNLLVTNGTLKIGDAILCGCHWGRVRALINDHGVKVKSVGPSTPVKCLGLSGVLEAGAEFKVCVNEKLARQQAEEAAQQLRLSQATPARKVSLTDLFKNIEEDKRLELNVILKTDVQGSIEAISHGLHEIKTEKVLLNVILGATGNITVNDVMLASASNAVILGFHVAKEPGVDAVCRKEGVEIRLHSIIYELIDQVREAMTGLLAPELKENVMGRAEIKQVFPIGKTATVAGCLVLSGTVRPRYKVRVKRGDEVLYQGSIASLKRFKDASAEVKETQECGIRLDNFSSFVAGDILEFYEIEEIVQQL